MGQADRLCSRGLAPDDAHGAGRKCLVRVEVREQCFELGEGREVHRALANGGAAPKSLGVPGAVAPELAHRPRLADPAREELRVLAHDRGNLAETRRIFGLTAGEVAAIM